LGGENIDHSEKKISYNHTPNSAYLRGEREREREGGRERERVV
jgi:hypothetical protein